MTGSCDVAIIGAGPAGLAAALEAVSHGLGVVLLDEQPEPGGQIYRNVSTNAAKSDELKRILGADYLHGAALASEFAAAVDAGKIDYRTDATVWQVDPAPAIHMSRGGAAQSLSVARVIVATGAMERPVPIPGWTLPGVMGAGAAQIMMKTAQAVPDGPVVLAGAGPLLLLVAQQLIDAGAMVAAVLETTRKTDYWSALPALPAALRGHTALRKGIAMRRRIREAGVPIHSGVRGLVAVGDDRVTAIRYRQGQATGEIAATTLLLHEGVVPNLQITRQIGCEHVWNEEQRCWRPALDDWGNTSLKGFAVAGDGGGIAGADAAVPAGRIAGLEAAFRLGNLSETDRDTLAAPLRRSIAKHIAIRPLLDALFRPNEDILVPPDAETIVCRCEEVTAGAIRDAVELGATGPNQMKSYLRCGMGPCQGRFCGLTVSNIIAAERGVSVDETGYYRIRPPIKPVTLGELAAADD
ncbi:MAG: FAD-dependent oxidoreductase [Pseudomonadota bacterium]